MKGTAKPDRLNRLAGPPAFTLVELLTVVALIAVLVSMMVAVVSGVRNQAKIAVCAACLHAVGRGLAVYSAEHNGKYPVGQMPFDVPQVELVSALSKSYVPSGEVFYCPGQTRPELQYSEQNFQQAMIGYFYYSCRQAAPFRSATSKVLRNFGVITPNWPRGIVAAMPPETWVMSDRWIAGEPAHPGGKHGMNRLALDASVTLISDSPAQVFR